MHAAGLPTPQKMIINAAALTWGDDAFSDYKYTAIQLTYLFVKTIEGKKVEGKRPVNPKIKVFIKWLKLYKQRNRFPSLVGRKVSFQKETETQRVQRLRDQRLWCVYIRIRHRLTRKI